MRFGKRSRLVLFAAGAGSCVLLAAAAAGAQEPLRWKFEVGEKLKYDMDQQMTLTMGGGPVGAMTMTTQQQMNMTWNVVEVDEQGDAVIRQTIDRVRMTMTGPMGQIAYDSDSPEPPAGVAAMVAPMFEAMTQGEFEMTMTARGEVKDVKLPDEMMAALRNNQQAAQLGDMGTPEGFQKMIMQGAMVLPEETPAIGESWTTKIEMEVPAAGKQTVETTYTYDGTREIEGASHAVFRPELTMSFEGNAAAQVRVKEQSSEGEVLFNAPEGRLHSSSLQQNVTMETTVQGQTMEQKIDQKIEVQVTPAETN